MEQFADNPTRKPVATVGFCEDLYLRSRLKHQISKVAHPPISRDDWPGYEYLRDLARRLRRPTKQAGKSVWPMIFAAACMIGFGFFLHSLRDTGYTFSAPHDKFRVLEQINSHDFILQRVENGIPQYPTEFHFCHDYQPRFEPGMTLVFLSYSDRGSCVSIAPKDKWYVVEKGADHWPTLPKNCTQDLAHDHVACNGKPQF